MVAMIHELLVKLESTDWFGLAVAAAFSGVAGGVIWFFKGLYETWVASNDLPYRISGIWYSAEFDPRDEADPRDRNTYTTVKIRRKLRGRFSIRVSEWAGNAASRPRAEWSFDAQLRHGATLVGTWKSTVKGTNRFGAAVLKFIDNERAVGYWIGPAGKEYPYYGYWVMSKSQDDTKALSIGVLESSGFQFADVGGYILRQNAPPEPPPAAKLG
jgi:hypothetical protein